MPALGTKGRTGNLPRFGSVVVSPLFSFTVDATIAGTSGIGHFVVPSDNVNYQLEWVEVGNESNNATIHVQSADYDIDFGGSGTYQIHIDPVYVPSGTNDFDDFDFDNTGDKLKLVSIDNWGVTAWVAMAGSLRACDSLLTTAQDQPDFSLITSFNTLFRDCDLVNPDTSNWDTSAINNMTYMFYNAKQANPDVSNWDVSSVTTIAYMFYDADAATPDTSSWVTSVMTRMEYAFAYCSLANPNVSSWDVSKVTTFYGMFRDTGAANPDVSGWDVSLVTNMSYMFYNADSATPDTSAWVTTALTNTSYMFMDCALANPDVSGWDVSKVISMIGMFRQADVINPDVSSWVTTALTNADAMFYFSPQANPDVSGWDVTNLTVAASMFNGAALSTVNYDALLIAWEAQAVNSSVPFHAGNATYTGGGAAETARSSLINTHGWVITDNGVAV